MESLETLAPHQELPFQLKQDRIKVISNYRR